MTIWELIEQSYSNYWNYLWKAISQPLDWPNGFYFLILVSLLVWGLELIFPWRKNQRAIRKDFWLDGFYMFFNYFFFGLIVFVALSNTTAYLFGQAMSIIGLPEDYLIDLAVLPNWVQFIIYFILYDIVQWGVHVVLHRVPFLWKFHKVHHSVREMGFAAHLRFHFMESVVYTTFKFVLLAYIFHFKLQDAFWIYFFTTLIGHLNHANVGWDYGPLKYILNNPKMHIWHHAKDMPKEHKHGMNFGITLSIWDYLFKTAYVPSDGRDIELGFPGIEEYPDDFLTLQYKPFIDHEG